MQGLLNLIKHSDLPSTLYFEASVSDMSLILFFNYRTRAVLSNFMHFEAQAPKRLGPYLEEVV